MRDKKYQTKQRKYHVTWNDRKSLNANIEEKDFLLWFLSKHSKYYFFLLFYGAKNVILFKHVICIKYLYLNVLFVEWISFDFNLFNFM